MTIKNTLRNSKQSVPSVCERQWNMMTKDNWKNKSTGMICYTCMHYMEKGTLDEDVQPKGRCKRHAPTMEGFPVVFNTDWCGDHKLK
jgi:hypothetical protein